MEKPHPQQSGGSLITPKNNAHFKTENGLNATLYRPQSHEFNALLRRCIDNKATRKGRRRNDFAVRINARRTIYLIYRNAFNTVQCAVKTLGDDLKAGFDRCYYAAHQNRMYDSNSLTGAALADALTQKLALGIAALLTAGKTA